MFRFETGYRDYFEEKTTFMKGIPSEVKGGRPVIPSHSCHECLFCRTKDEAREMKKWCGGCLFKHVRFGHKHKSVRSFSLTPEIVADLARRSSNRSMALDFALARYMKLMADGHQRIIEELGEAKLRKLFRLLKHYPTVRPHRRGHARSSGDDSPASFDERERVLKIISHHPRLKDEVAKLDDLRLFSFLDMCERYHVQQGLARERGYHPPRRISRNLRA